MRCSYLIVQVPPPSSFPSVGQHLLHFDLSLRNSVEISSVFSVRISGEKILIFFLGTTSTLGTPVPKENGEAVALLGKKHSQTCSKCTVYVIDVNVNCVVCVPGFMLSAVYFLYVQFSLSVSILEKLSDMQCQPESQLKFITEAWQQMSTKIDIC
ncbi:hypothetical protein DVH24_034292 [Malus domestica]|uniref:Uncharacterized protein n=1 Tax=Malus domestica TaxID=3750 RepID=A0A498J0B0_MALDO|nr:hypothetical protein DVH24_034292 [Malus domestica]